MRSLPVITIGSLRVGMVSIIRLVRRVDMLVIYNLGEDVRIVLVTDRIVAVELRIQDAAISNVIVPFSN